LPRAEKSAREWGTQRRTPMDDATRLLLYKILHLAGLMSLFIGVGALLVPGVGGAVRKPALVFHGIGLALLLVSGFGMMAKLHLSYTAGWVLLKLGAWIFFGGVIVLSKRGVLHGTVGWAICATAGLVAAWAGLLKPF